MEIYYNKAAGILIKSRKLLVTREKGKIPFIAPGGSIEKGETPKETIIRELKEEVNVFVDGGDLEEFGTFLARAAGDEEKYVQMTCFLVKKWEGDPVPTNGEEVIEEILWLTSKIPEDIKVGSIFEHEVIPRLKKQGLID
ncbi:MAG: NUDIX domain-containing protein [Patescibacteria group bacterium]